MYRLKKEAIMFEQKQTYIKDQSKKLIHKRCCLNQIIFLSSLFSEHHFSAYLGQFLPEIFVSTQTDMVLNKDL